MLHFIPDVILEEEVFVFRNLGPECNTIGDLLCDYGVKSILSALEDGEYAMDVDNYLQLLDSLCVRFFSDEHGCWFDDMYSPDYTVSQIWDNSADGLLQVGSEVHRGDSLEQSTGAGGEASEFAVELVCRPLCLWTGVCHGLKN